MFLKNFLEYFIMSSSVKFPFEINLILNFKNFGSFRKGFFINLKTITFFLIENYFLHTKKNLIIRLLIGFNLKLRLKLKEFIGELIFFQTYKWFLFRYLKVLDSYFIQEQFFLKFFFKKLFKFELFSRTTYLKFFKNNFCGNPLNFPIIKNEINQTFVKKHFFYNTSSNKLINTFSFLKNRGFFSKIPYLDYITQKKKIELFLNRKQKKLLIKKKIFFNLKNSYKKFVNFEFFLSFSIRLKPNTQKTGFIFISKKTKPRFKSKSKNILIFDEPIYFKFFIKIIKIIAFLSRKKFFYLSNLSFFHFIKKFSSHFFDFECMNFFVLKNFYPEINLDFLLHSNSNLSGMKIGEKKQNYFFKFYYFLCAKKILKKTKLFLNLFRARIQIKKTLNNFSVKKKILFYFPYIEILLGKFKKKIVLKFLKKFDPVSSIWRKLQLNFCWQYFFKKFNFEIQGVKMIGCKNQKVLVLWRKIFFLTGNYLVYKGIGNFFGKFKSFFLNYLIEKKNKKIHYIFKINSIRTLNVKNLLTFFFFKSFLGTKHLLKCVKQKKWIFHENFEMEKNSGILFLKIRLSILIIYKNITYSENFF